VYQAGGHDELGFVAEAAVGFFGFWVGGAGEELVEESRVGSVPVGFVGAGVDVCD